MALTGKGIETNPYIIRSYDDLRESQTATPESGDILYLKLGRNINCKDYGDQFLWHTIKYDRHTTIIDLDGHYIKNAYIADEECMFQFEVEPTTHYNRIYNGDIVNVFCHNADYIIYTTKECVSVHFYKVRFSINLNTIMAGVFKYAIFDTCSFFIFCDGLLFANGDSITYRTLFELYNKNIVSSSITPQIDACITKCDIMLDISPTKMFESVFRIFKTRTYNNSNGTILRNSRVQGKIDGGYSVYITYGGANTGWNYSGEAQYMDSNVFNLDLIQASIRADIYTRGYFMNAQLHYANIFYNSKNVVLNGVDKNVVNVTKDQLKDAEYLKSVFFPVERIEV